MTGSMIRSTSRDTFHILEDEEIPRPNIGPGPGSDQRPAAPTGPREVLNDLPIHNCQNKAAAIASGAGQGPCHCEYHNQGHESLGITSIIDKLQPRIAALPTLCRLEPKHPPRPHRRPPIDLETFQPLDAVQEEASFITDNTRTEDNPASSSLVLQEGDLDNHDLLKNAVPDGSIRDQVKKHLAGQFDWLMSYPPLSDSTEHYSSHNGHTVSRESRNQVYGCNLLLRKGRPAASTDINCEPHSANSYILLARPLKGYANTPLEMDEPKIITDDSFIACIQAPDDPVTPLKVPEIVQAVENAVSPSLTVVSDRSCSFGDASSRTGSFSLSRIEDSLEELDRLEDELEALDEVTRSRQIPLIDSKPTKNTADTPSTTETSKALKRASASYLSATVRVKSSEKMEPSLRRSSSLTLRDKRQAETKSGGTQPTTKPSAKSAKRPTVPNFELPGEAVSRRLKEQREARQAQQAEALKASAPSVKPRANKHLPKPNFELPGEAISRRKREEREAKLRAQEEEERKRREFKARPMKQNSAPSTVPRETIASRARQAKIQEEHAEKQASAHKAKRLSIGPSRATPGTPTTTKPQHTRGRKSTIISMTDASRATSSTGSLSGKRSSISTEEVVQQRLRGKEIYVRDNNSFMEKRGREKREREIAAKSAREQAAERSRIASREWAEKKRLKEAALKEAMQREMA